MYTSPQSESVSPFVKSSTIARSPIAKSVPQPHHKLKETPTNKEIIISQAKEKVVDSTFTERMNSYEKLCQSLQKQVDELKLENQRLKESLTKNDKSSCVPMESTNSIEFHTDEEELAQETKWILQKNKNKSSRKRKAESSPGMETPVKSSKTNKETLIFSKSKQIENSKKPKLPPVILSNINDFNKVQDVMSVQKIKYEIKLLNNKQLSMKVFSEDDYRSLTKALNEANFEWHSYEIKATRPCKVIARGLHSSCKTELISDDLKELGFNILSVVNVTKKKKINDKVVIEPLPLFMLSFDHSEDIKKLFSITHILNHKVKIEAIRKQKEQIPQCRRCQRFEHTQSYCKREPRCVKCAGKHLTIECKLDRKAPPKCSNCDKAHPANYRGCIVAKEFQNRRLAKKKGEHPKNKKPVQQKLSTPKTSKGVSYADVAKKPTTPNSIKTKKNVKSTPKTQKTNSSSDGLFTTYIERIFVKLDEIFSRLDKIENSRAKKHVGTPRSILK